MIVYSQQAAGEGEGFAIGDEDGGVDFAYRRSIKGEEEQNNTGKAETHCDG